MIDVLLERLTPAPRNVLMGRLTWPPLNGPAPGVIGTQPAGTCATLEDALIFVPYNGPTTIDNCIKHGITGMKVPGWTAIPEGRYRMRFTWSNRFKRWLPELFDVRGFTAIRLHAGNTVHDTNGCILLGAAGLVGQMIGSSREVTDEFCRWLGDAEQQDEVWLTVRNPT